MEHKHYWDDFGSECEQIAETERQFWEDHREHIVRIVAAIISTHRSFSPASSNVDGIIEDAGEIVRGIVDRGMQR